MVLGEKIENYLKMPHIKIIDSLKEINQYMEKNPEIKIDYLYKSIIAFFLTIFDKDKDFFLEKLINLFSEIMNGSSCIEIDEKDKNRMSKYPEIFELFEDNNLFQSESNLFKTPFVIRKIDSQYLLYLHKYFYEEKIIEDILIKRIKNNCKNEVRIKIDDPSKENIKKSLEYKTVFITGGPGTGKTYLSSLIYKYFKENFKLLNQREPLIKICAPTGKAARVLKEKIFYNIKEKVDVSTIHRLLEYNPIIGDFNYNKKKKLLVDLILIDEASMIDLVVFRKLLEAIPDESNLVIVGDKDQLPSVNTGSVFSNLIENNFDFKIELQKQYRSNSNISDIAKSIKTGEFDFSKFKIYTNIHNLENLLINSENGVYYFDISLKENLVSVLEKWFNHYYKDFKKSIILTPYNEENIIGVDRINETLIKFLKHKNEKGDIPIIVMQNDYENNIFNSDIGYKKLDNRVYFNENIIIPLNLLKNYKYAFAITIHKSQGSEYDDVFLFIPDEESQILTKELIYTAITRAKNRVFIFGKKDVFQKSIKKSLERKSGIKYIKIK
ncbi:MAG TPA: AAA family ATPase [Spirochaetota bacterium]|nr:AAA family ATPase [Spirochaetota bacterium]HOL57446.1 AAA family ATPase [Spirochaetota bacterium]HPP04973.1 AAA family ATPase [Spirochaetota bacterium]